MYILKYGDFYLNDTEIIPTWGSLDKSTIKFKTQIEAQKYKESMILLPIEVIECKS